MSDQARLTVESIEVAGGLATSVEIVCRQARTGALLGSELLRTARFDLVGETIRDAIAEHDRICGQCDLSELRRRYGERCATPTADAASEEK